jgi:Tfp pilus assembly protein PilO
MTKDELCTYGYVAANLVDWKEVVRLLFVVLVMVIFMKIQSRKI